MLGEALHLPAQPQARAWLLRLVHKRRTCMSLLASCSGAVSLCLPAAQEASMARPAAAEL